MKRVRTSRLEWLVIAAFAIVFLAFAWDGAPESPFFDDWVWIIHARAFAEGGVAGFLETGPLLHFQHFYVLPSLFALLFGPLVDYSFRPFALVSAAFVFALGLTFWRLAKREGLAAPAAFLVLFFVVSIRHHENMWVGFQLGLPACVLLGTMSVIVADARRDRTGLLLAALLGVASVACSSAGILSCAAVILVRGYAPRLSRLWIVAAIVALFVLIHFLLVALDQRRFIEEALMSIAWSRVPLNLATTVRLVGAGVISGPAAVPVGAVLVTGSLVMVVTRIKRMQRVDAFVGLILCSLATCFLVALTRPPVDNPGSRHAIFAAPLVGVCAIACFSWLRRTPSVRALGYAVVLVGAGLCTWANLAEVVSFRRMLRVVVLNSDFSIALAKQGVTLTPHETLLLFIGAPHEDVQRAVQFVADRELCGSSWKSRKLETHADLPSLSQGATNVRTESGQLHFAGTGHIYNDYACSESSGRLIRLSVEVSTLGTAGVGIIVLRPDGSERSNFSVAVPSGGEFTTLVARSRAGPGDRIQPYVFAVEPDKTVTVKSFQIVMVDAPFDPELR